MAQVVSPLLEELDGRGYVIVDDVFDPQRDLQPVLDEYAVVLDRLAVALHRERRIRSEYQELPFGRRLIEITRECQHSLAAHFDIALPNSSKGIRSDTPIHNGPACFRLLTNERLLDTVEGLVGPEILVSPVGHVRIKLPEHTVPAGAGDGLMERVPWHQDNGVVLGEADGSNVLSVWFPITEATIENGCLQIIPTPRSAELLAHCPKPLDGGLQIPDRYVDDGRAVPLPMQPGSVLMFHPRTVHSSLENTTTDQVRISMDLRYQPIGQPTGRPMFPSFIARSRSNPEQELRDPNLWSEMWLEARARLAVDQPTVFNRWDPNSPVCA